MEFQRIGLEAGPLSPWLYEGLRAAGFPAICIETRRMKGATAVMAVKTDRNDARAIAQAIRVGWYTAVHVKTAESQQLRLLLTNRKTLQAAQLTLENEIRGTLKAFGLKVGPITIATFEGRVLELVKDNPRLLAMVRPMLLARESLRTQFAALHRMGIACYPDPWSVPKAIDCTRRRACGCADLCHRCRYPRAISPIKRCRSAFRSDTPQVCVGRD